MKRLVYIDSLRGIASLIVAVIWHYQHFSNAFQPNTIGSVPPLYWFAPLRFFFDHGDIMVDLFFVLSGVVFSYTYRTSIKTSKDNAYSFFVKRFSRLYPIHFFTLILSAFLAYVYQKWFGRYPLFEHNNTYHFSSYYFLLNVAFLQKGFFDKGYSFNVPAWSLSIEAFMYLLFFLQSRRKFVLHTSTFLVLLGLFIFKLRYNSVFLINEPIARGLIGFFTGCILYEEFLMNGLYIKYRLVIISFFTMFGIAYIALISKQITIPINLVMIFIAIPLIAELHTNKLIHSIVNFRPLIFLGDISLSVYLIHVPIQFIILMYFNINEIPLIYNSNWLFIFYIFCVITLGWLLHITVEMPAQSWLRLRMQRTEMKSV